MSDITLTVEIARTPRVMQVEGMFDIDSAEKSETRIPLRLPNIDEKSWNIGLIVGPSGSGKSTVAKHLFPDQLSTVEDMKWRPDSAIVDEFPSDMPVQEVTTLLSSVGFSSPPAWLRPFSTLSNGEQFRVTMARVLAEQKDLAVIDEFTSVVDRTVAKIGSHAIAKTVRKRDQKLVAVSCHYDVQEWLQPDWVYQPDSGRFTWRSVQPRPTVELELRREPHTAWATFARHHYLNETLHKAAAIIVGYIDKQPAALVATLPQPHAQTKNLWRVSRIVTAPDFQGIGLGNVMIDEVGAAHRYMNRTLTIVTSHPALMRTLNKGKTWNMIRKPSRLGAYGERSKVCQTMRSTTSRGRLTASFKYIGASKPDMVDLYQTTR